MRLWLILIALAIPFLSNAQDFGAGIETCLTASQLDGDRYAGYHKIGFGFGAHVSRMLLTDRIGMRIGLRYIRKGSHQEATESTPYYKSELHYAEHPLTIFYHWQKLNFEVGATVGYLIKSKEDTDGYGLREPNINFNKIEIGAIAGLRYRLVGSLWAHASLCYSVLPVRQHHAAQDGHKISGQHNNVIIIGACWVLK
jgi:hypothetical protein